MSTTHHTRGAHQYSGVASAERKSPTGDIVRIDIQAGRCDMLVSDAEIARRKQDGIPAVPASATPWQEMYRASVGQMDSGAVLEAAVKYRGVAAKTPRHNH